MTAKPRILDLFCGAGGAAQGYANAGFDVLGVDIKAQPNYPFEFVQDDALDYLLGMAVSRFDAIHASPPCQDYSKALAHLSAPQPRLIQPTRELLEATGLPWIIENVPGSSLPRQDTLDGRHGVELCGSMFGLRVYRHRLFETKFPVCAPSGCNHIKPALNPYNAQSRRRDGIEKGAEAAFATAMGVEWMNGKRGDVKSEIGEAIPPAYTEFIGHQLMAHVRQKAAA